MSAPTAESSTTQTSKASKPYRVTNTTIQDIKDFHKSQLCEYDYVVDDSWVSGACCSCLCGLCWGHTGIDTNALMEVQQQSRDPNLL